MKKTLLFAIIGIAMTTLCILSACGISVKGADGTEYETYQECCSAQDFEAAHLYLAKMENAMGDDYDKQKEYEAAREYVFKQETLYLMSIGDETAKKRILYLLKEEGNNNERVDMLIDLAIDNDDEEFVKVLLNHLHKYDEECIAKVIEYMSSKSNEDNSDVIEQLVKTYLSLENNYIINYLASSNNREHDEMILGLLTAKQQEISQRPNNHFDAWCGDGDRLCENYVSSVKKYNASCLDILGIAIKNRNKNLAQRAVSLFRPNIHWESKEKNNRTWTYKVTPDNNELKEAKTTLNEAIHSGVFK